jgi:hypothetical protein
VRGKTLKASGRWTRSAAGSDAGAHAGCIKRNGAITLPIPTISAGPIVGWRTQAKPQMPSSSAANAMPIA